jgi:hypothetical protein
MFCGGTSVLSCVFGRRAGRTKTERWRCSREGRAKGDCQYGRAAQNVNLARKNRAPWKLASTLPENAGRAGWNRAWPQLATKWTWKTFHFCTRRHPPSAPARMDLMEAETMELLASRFHLEGGNMNPGIIQVRVALIVAALIASVAADEPNGSTIAKDPCALALVPHEGTDKEDLEIIRLQTKVRTASHPTTWPEQLGWAFKILAAAQSANLFLPTVVKT